MKLSTVVVLTALLAAGVSLGDLKLMATSFLGVDFGSQFIKSTTSMPGKGLGIVVDEGGHRKVASIVCSFAACLSMDHVQIVILI